MSKFQEEIELKALVFMNESEIGLSSDVNRIVLRKDGSGISGEYDRLHVYFANGNHSIFPAHNVQGWALKDSHDQS